MDLTAIDELVRRSAGGVIADPRLVRRIIKQHCGMSGSMPHARCYPIAKAALLGLVDASELGLLPEEVPAEPILLARRSPRDVSERSRADVLTRLWRAIFHARVHQSFARKAGQGELSEADIRRRIGLIGQTEFDEIRATLRHDELVLPPFGDREVYIEFAALYLELRYFAPNLLITTFPGLGPYDRVDKAIRLDIDVEPLLEDQRPDEVPAPASTKQLGGTSSPSFSVAPSFGIAERLGGGSVSVNKYRRMLERAQAARKRGNDVRAALLSLRAGLVEDKELRRKADKMAREATASLGKRMSKALRATERRVEWSSLLYLLADRGAGELYPQESRLLYSLQRAAVAFERGQRIVDVATFILSMGKRPVVRTLKATRELNVARHVHAADARVRHVRLGSADRKLVAKLLTWASERADENVRVALRPRLYAVLDKVGLRGRSDPEKLSRDKLVEELLDHVVARGFLSFGSLRDALSRNQIKLEDLDGPGELVGGDALIKADAELSVALDGIYQRSDVYLRWLQKVSSVPFGTRLGRLIFLYALLPLGASYVLLDGLGHIVSPALGWLGLQPIQPLNLTSFLITAGVVLALLHSAPFRAFAWQLLELVGLILATVFFRLPRALFSLPALRLWLARPAVRMAVRRLLLPAVIGMLVYYLVPFEQLELLTAKPLRRLLAPAVALGCFLTSSAIMGSPVGAFIEDFFVDQLAPTWQVLSRQWIPGLLRLIVRFFAAMMDLLQRAIYRVDEALRFHEGENAVLLAFKGVFGLLWAIVAWVIRLYVTLLIEPELNPLKHFPVVTVAHKLLLPITPALIMAFQTPLAPFGSFVSGTVAGVTVFLLPSVFGFLAWELKENYKLYRATRPEDLGKASVGPHGETMRGLLVVGLHSGTLPKLYERLRRAAQREDEAMAASQMLKRASATTKSEGLGRFRDGIRQAGRSVRRFVERELVAMLARSRRWNFGELSVVRVDLSSNRVRLKLVCASFPKLPCEVTFEEQSGYIVAGIGELGFVSELRQHPTASLLFENALAGIYQRAEVDLVREQIVAELGDGVHYDVADEGLLVWPGRDYETELVYRIGARGRGALPPRVRGAEPAEPPRVLDTQQLLFRQQTISWLAWVAAWSAADHETAEIPRLLGSASILGAGDVEAPTDGTPTEPPSTRQTESRTAAARSAVDKTGHQLLQGSPAPAVDVADTVVDSGVDTTVDPVVIVEAVVDSATENSS